MRADDYGVSFWLNAQNVTWLTVFGRATNVHAFALTDGEFVGAVVFAENIAFGVTPRNIDLERVKQAARQAQIADFIESNPNGYQANVGERGIRLSGGQRQGVGIARALYKQASVLVFDEATSALDNATEQSVMDAIDGLSSNLTILLIAHRLTTLRRCDTFVELGHGRVLAQGTYEQLLERSAASAERPGGYHK